MKQTIELNEFDTGKQALNGEDYDAWETNLEDGQKNYSNLVMGSYKFLYPVLVDKYSSLSPIPQKGWLCQNTDNGKFKVILNLNASQMYIKYCSNSSYLGLEYIKEDMVYSRFSLEGFEKETEEEISKLIKKDKWYEDFLKGHKEKYLYNIKKNLDMFATLDKGAFNEEINRVVNKYHFREVQDMSSYKNCLYLAVLDDYNQFYVGKCVGGLKNRMRKHWVAKVIPNRQLWIGSDDFSRAKYDNFQMFDTTRIFVCDDIKKILEENAQEANDPNLVWSNTFGIKPDFEEMKDLDKAERIVINNSKCIFTLSDRVPLPGWEKYKEFSERFNVPEDELLIKHFLAGM